VSLQRLVLLLVTILAPVASAGTSMIDLVPRHAGPYALGQSIPIDIYFVNNEGLDIDLRELTLDFSATSPEVGLPATFEFNTSTLLIDVLYTQFDQMPRVDMVYTSQQPMEQLIVHVPDGASYLVGTLEVIYPDSPGSYFVDAINARAPDTNSGALFAYGFDHRVNLHYTFGNLAGSPIYLVAVAVPEPATVALLGIGGLALVIQRRRRSAKMNP